MKRLIKFTADAGRSGVVSGLFIATEEELNKAFGTTVFLGEVLGKHSDIQFDLGPEFIDILATEEATVEDMEKAAGSTNIVGYNPLDYLYDEND